MTSRTQVVPRSAALVADYPPGATYGPRRLPDHELVWVLRGSARWTVERPGGEVHAQTLRPGVLALSQAGTTDSYLWDDGGPSAHAYVHFSLAGRHTADPTSWPLTRPMLPDDPLDGLCRYLLTLADLGGDRARERSDQVVGLVWDLFVHGPLPSSTPGPPEPLRASLEFVRRTWDADGVRRLPVAAVAAGGSVSAGYFSRRFHEHFGCGPAAALELVRLARAASTLQRSNLDLARVARLSGFGDPYHFSRRFKAAYGVPPGRFRRSRLHPLAPVEGADLLPLWRLLAPPDA